MPFGPELIIDGGFDNGLSDWDHGTGVSVVGGECTFVGNGNWIAQYPTVTVGSIYRVEFDWHSSTINKSISIKVRLNTQFQSYDLTYGSTQHITHDFTITTGDVSGGFFIEFDAQSSFILLDNISFKEVLRGTLPAYEPSIITSVNRVMQNLSNPQFIIAGQNSSIYKLFKKSHSYAFTNWRTPVYQIGKNFDVLEVSFPILPDMTTNMSIIPVLYFDNEDSSSIGNTINATNYPNADRLIRLTSKSFGNAVHGKNNFFLELQFTGSALSVVELPLNIELEVEE